MSDVEWPISREMEVKIYWWHRKLLPHILARQDPIVVPNYWCHPADNYSREVSALLQAVTADIGTWMQSLLPDDHVGGPACIYFHPEEATLMVGDTDYYLPLKAA
jgi:hypothetical protein